MTESRPWPPELLARVIKAMCPSQVCRTCGAPRRRISEHMGEERRLNPPSLEEFATALTGAMKERGVTHHQVAGWLGVAESVVRHYLGKTGTVNHRLPSVAAWRQLSDLLPFTPEMHEAMGTVPPTYETWDQGDRTIPERLYKSSDGPPKVVPTGWSDCGHDDFRPGVVLDPFGDGTTGAVATALGRDGIEVGP